MADHLDEEALAALNEAIAAINGTGPNSLQSLIERGVLSGDGTETGGEGGGGGPVPLPSSGVFDVYVENGLRSAINASLSQYKMDLEAEGYQVRITEFAGSAADLRADLQDRWATVDLEGALFVGDLPVQTFQSFAGFNETDRLEEYPHDLYFMDLDGTYTFVAGGADEHVDGTGDVAPEIYVSRLSASQLGSLTSDSEADLINAYFEKLHNVRAGTANYQERAIWFADDDWSPYVGDLDAFIGLYDNVTDIRDRSETTEAKYEELIQDDVETLVQQIHSWPSGLSISGTGGGFVTSSDLVTLNPQPAFLNLFNCSAANFTQNANLASTYTFLSDGVLNTIGSTKTGAMLSFADFYQPQAADLSLGQSFREWFEDHAAPTDNPGLDWKIDWHYGMTMQGDPTMGPAVLRAIMSIIEIVGTEGPDVLQGTFADEHIFGLGGDDLLKGLDGADLLKGAAGNDTLNGGGGDDTLDGGRGDDVLLGSNGDDLLRGGSGSDTLNGGRNDDTLNGGGGDDSLNGGGGDDNLKGSGGDDLLKGGAGDDLLVGGTGNDTLTGGDGADRLVGGHATNRLVGGADADTFIFQANATGASRIIDFDLTEDVLKLSGVAAASVTSDAADNAIILLQNGGEITMIGIDDTDALGLAGLDFLITI